MRNKWTPEEDRILRDNHPTKTLSELAAIMPRHPYYSIKNRCRALGLIKTIKRGLTAEQKQYVQQHYHNTLTADLAKSCNCSMLSIYNYAHSIGLKKDADFIVETNQRNIENLTENALDGLRKIHLIMNDFKTRLIEEQAQLEEKLHKLNAFNQSKKVNEIDSVQKSLLLVQAGTMYTYNEILKARLERL